MAETWQVGDKKNLNFQVFGKDQAGAEIDITDTITEFDIQVGGPNPSALGVAGTSTGATGNQVEALAAENGDFITVVAKNASGSAASDPLAIDVVAAPPPPPPAPTRIVITVG